jgi:ribonuclease BN (tRNA processing enzyme)
MSLKDRTKPLLIIGPADIQKWLKPCSTFLSRGPGSHFKLNFIRTSNSLDVETESLQIKAAEARHLGTCYAYSLRTKSKPPRTIGYSGDTRPTDALCKFFMSSDLLIFDSTYGRSNETLALKYKDSTSPEAADLARRARAGQLVLTHFSARNRNISSLVNEARSIFPKTVAASDGMTVEI